MLQIKRAGHSTLTTPDIERMVDYFTRIGGLSLVARNESAPSSPPNQDSKLSCSSAAPLPARPGCRFKLRPEAISTQSPRE